MPPIHRPTTLLGATALALTTLAAPAHAASVPVTPAYAAAPAISGVYAAGVSSGGYMADQLHIAYSGTVSGAGIFTAGPYHCAQGSLTTAELACMNDISDDQPQALEQTIATRSANGQIDPAANLTGDPVWIYHGTGDTTVKESVADDLAAVNQHTGADVAYTKTSPAGHSWVSPLGPNPCASSYSPYVNNCGDDPENAMLTHLLGATAAPAATPTGTLTTVDQNPYTPGGSASAISMSATGYAYTPTTCTTGTTCRLLVALHGCLQSADTIGTTFITKAHLNEYADTNNLVVLYPQASANASLGNPQGCWNWWGYGADTSYDMHGGKQLTTLINMIHAYGG